MYGQDPITAVCSSETHWTSHDRACKAFYKVYKQFLVALAICCNESKESEALSLSILTLTPKILATVLMLLQVFNCIRSLNFLLQKGQESLCINQAQAVVAQEEFDKIDSQAFEQVLLLPSSTNLRCGPSQFSSFQSDTLQNLLLPLKENLAKHLGRCISRNVFWHLILEDCQKILAKLQNAEMTSLKS